MSLGVLKWVVAGAAAAFLLLLEALRAALGPTAYAAGPSYLIVAGVALVGVLVFTEAVFRLIGQVQQRLAQRNQELLALHQASLAITGQLDVETVLQAVVDQARDLAGARYGALSILREGGGIEAFLTSGISPEERARIGALPVGRGLLGVVLREGQRLRLKDLTRDPRSFGFPPHHPPMRSLLAVPIASQGRVVGNLYLTEKQQAPEFSEEDEETLVRFATQAALVIENARLHRQVQAVAVTEERERIAREMHDSLAAVLGYVNTKAQAAQELLEGGRHDRAAEQIGQLAEAARAAYADVREGILGLRTSLGPQRGLGETLAEYIERWQELSGVAVDWEASVPDGVLRQLPPAGEVQLLRIVQEAMTNIRKHAGASRAHVRLVEAGGGIEVEVADNGVGFDPSTLGRGTLPRFGLATMRERAEAVGGSLTIESSPGHGTRVIARLPGLLASSTTGGADARTDR